MNIDKNWNFFIQNFLHSSINLTNFDDFLNWPVIKQTMFIGNPDYVNNELSYLKDLKNWNKWENAIKECNIGNPERYPSYQESSGNLIHHAYHIALFENTTKLEVNNFDTVFEFGGGYGSMCRLFNNLNYKNKYIICDLPEFIELQKYYLNKLNIQCDHINENQLKDYEFVGKKLFIATWSLSETPQKLMDDVTNKVKDFDGFLIAFNKTFVNGNNPLYFERFIESIGDINYRIFEIKHMPNNFYLIGVKNNVYINHLSTS